ncbi:DUF6924 domain-containing protein [Streptomyces sp. CA-250714]|uniref:DUF6924 domain-containing protein n=1 Tax=Streptomyces sp. CA-250714 TaxID=3240060 RepID=UPI003D92F84F
MAPLPQPDIDSSLVLRTDFGDDSAWEGLAAAVEGDGGATCVSDRAYAGVSVQALVEADAAADDEEALTYVFLADSTAMADDEQRLLAVDLYEEPGRTFRVPPRWFASVSANLALANMDFAEYADAADESGTFRGF